jgi:hypothetical protein
LDASLRGGGIGISFYSCSIIIDIRSLSQLMTPYLSILSTYRLSVFVAPRKCCYSRFHGRRKTDKLLKPAERRHTECLGRERVKLPWLEGFGLPTHCRSNLSVFHSRLALIDLLLIYEFKHILIELHELHVHSDQLLLKSPAFHTSTLIQINMRHLKLLIIAISALLLPPTFTEACKCQRYKIKNKVRGSRLIAILGDFDKRATWNCCKAWNGTMRGQDCLAESIEDYHSGFFVCCERKRRTSDCNCGFGGCALYFPFKFINKKEWPRLKKGY